MAQVKEEFLATLRERFGKLQKLGDSRSVFELGNGAFRIYIRYSKVHEQRGQTFFGLRKTDLNILEGHRSFICFLWDGQEEPLVLPYENYEEVFNSIQPAGDGQYKVQVYRRGATELYIAKAGRFNVDAHYGLGDLERAIAKRRVADIPELAHAQVQTLLGAIGVLKGYDLWIPQHDREQLDWAIAKRFRCRERLPEGYKQAEDILGQIDVVWIERGKNRLNALYEVEHSTTIYSGLLRLNDLHLIAPQLEKFTIVANEERRSVFSKHLNRPTFQTSNLSETCAFLDYQDVYQWHQRIQVCNQTEVTHE